MTGTAIIIGSAAACRQLERQLDLLEHRPVSLGWVTPSGETVPKNAVHLGCIDELEAIVAHRRPTVALVTMPAAMTELITSVRTRLRKLCVPDRFMPTLDDQLAGIGPRTQIDVDVSQLLSRPPRQIDQDAIRSVIAGRRVLITGAGGSIGSELARMSARFDPEQLVMIDRSENALFEIDRQIARSHPHVNRKAILHDVVDQPATLQHFLTLQPQVIFHAAAHKHVPMMEDHPGAAVDNNLFGTKSVADAARVVDAERFVMISTDKAVNPSSIMGATKRLAELYVQHVNQRAGTCFSIVRFGNVLGSSGSVLDIWSKEIATGGPLTVTHPEMTRYFMTIPEAAALVMQSAALIDETNDAGEVFLLDMGDPVRIVDLAQRYIRQHGLTPVLNGRSSMPQTSRVGEIEIIFSGARPGEKLHEQLAFDAEAMRPTRHADINIWMLCPPDDRYIARLTTLDPTRRPSDAAELARLIRGLVPAPEMALPIAAA